MFSLTKTLHRLVIVDLTNLQKISVRCKTKYVETPVIGHGVSFRRKVHFPEEYTVKPLEVTHLGGRDPNTGRMVVKGIGGGIKHKYHWVDWKRVGPKEGPPQVSRLPGIDVSSRLVTLYYFRYFLYYFFRLKE